MFLKRFLKVSIFLCFVIGFLFLFFIYYRIYRYSKIEKKFIHEKQVEEQRYTQIPYIEIPTLHISKIIKSSTDKEILDKYYIGIWNKEKNIDQINHLVLAGHNVKSVFGTLHKIEIGDKVYIFYKDKKYIYQVSLKKEIYITEMDYLKDTNYKKLSLLTCTKNNQIRLLVQAIFQESHSL